MNDTFNIKRFAAYGAKRYSENWRRYLFGVALLAAILILIIVFKDAGNFTPRDLAFFCFTFVLFGGTGLMVLSEMQPLRSKHAGPIACTLPCSKLESYLFVLLNTTVVLYAIYSVVYTVVAGGAVLLGVWDEMFWPWGVGEVNEQLFLFINAMAVFAGTTRMRSHVWAFVVVAAIAIPLFCQPFFQLAFINGKDSAAQLMPYLNGIESSVTEGGVRVMFQTPVMFGKAFQYYWEYIQLIVWAVVLWVAGYFKYSERQIA